MPLTETTALPKTSTSVNAPFGWRKKAWFTVTGKGKPRRPETTNAKVPVTCPKLLMLHAWVTRLPGTLNVLIRPLSYKKLVVPLLELSKNHPTTSVSLSLSREGG
jgi:hypothetical protein